MMNDDTDMRKYNLQLVSLNISKSISITNTHSKVSGVQSGSQQQIIYTESDSSGLQTSKPALTSVVMTASPSSGHNHQQGGNQTHQVSLIQAVPVSANDTHDG